MLCVLWVVAQVGGAELPAVPAPSVAPSPAASPSPAAAGLLNAEATPAQRAPLPGERFPETATRQFTFEELKSCSLEDLRYAIFEIYARRGVTYDSTYNAKWFSRFAWFHPRAYNDYGNLDGMWTALEDHNVQEFRAVGSDESHHAIVEDAAIAQKPAKGGPVRAVIVDEPPDPDDPKQLCPYGNIEIVFPDGHSERLTKENHCGTPHLSLKGAVGWVYGNFSDPPPGPERRSGKDVVVVRLPDGKRKTFGVDKEARFIEEWMFSDNDRSILIKSRAHHGPAAFQKYDLKTGRDLGSMYGYAEWEKMPRWAWPFGDD